MAWKIIDEGKDIDPRDMVRDLEQALRRAGHVIAEGFKEVPPKRPGEKHLAGPLPGGFYSNKQWAFVMGGIKSGLLQVPYTRTGNLPRSWSVSAVTKRRDKMWVDVFSDPSEAPYNVFVQDKVDGKGLQVPMHSDWPTLDTVVKTHGDKAIGIVQNALKKWGFD